jgi:hypothetical protein
VEVKACCSQKRDLKSEIVTSVEKSCPRRLFSYKNDIFFLAIYLLLKMAGRGPGRAPGEYINLPSNAAADVDAYFDYRAYENQNLISK